MVTLRENQYQARLIKRLNQQFPGCIVLKTDTSYQQGFPDLIILWGTYWASLEVKPSARFDSQPNQGYFIERLNNMSFAAFIYPENEEEVLYALQQAFESPRRARISQP
jgi:hypothetical protein